jgi:hypothetical protein
MSIVETRAPALPKMWSLPHTVLSTVTSYAVMLSQAFEDAQQMARDAHRRYPFCNW